MKRSALYTAIASVLTVASAETYAAMPAEAILDFTGTFSMTTGGGPILTNISSGRDGGILTGAGITQPIGAHLTHGGANHPAQGNLDKEWDFFGNAGQSFTNSAITVTDEDVNSDGGFTKELDFSGWRVSWNAIPEIDMGGGFQDCGTSTDGICVDAGGNDIAGTYDNGNQLATITCGTADCPFGSTFTLTYASIVPQADPSNFGGVPYGVNITGTVLNPAGKPIANDDSAATIVGNPIVIDVLANDTQNPDPTTVTVTVPASDGATDDSDPAGTITYTPDTGPDFMGTDTFNYTVANNAGTSNPATVTVDVQDNVAPVARDDQASANTASLDNSGGKLTINVINNDTDANNDPGLPGGIDVTKVSVLTQPSIGSCTANATTGTVTYSQTPPSVEVSTSCTYEVMDIDSFGTPLTSNIATVAIDIASLSSDWPPALDTDIIPYLIFEDGVPNKSDNTADVPESGTYFSMDVSANTTIYTTLTKGTDGGLLIGYDQISGNSHTGSPTGKEITTVDLGWSFFGNTGMTFTKNGGITGNSDGSLKFSGTQSVNGGQGKYQITWNGIPEIDLGGSDKFPQDLGFGLISCNPAPCADGSAFDLNYEAHVPPGDPSGFGGVQYKLIMNGDVVFLDGSFQASSGTFSVGERLTTSDVEPDPDSEIQCAGGCFDYTVTGVTGSAVSVILPLNGGVPADTPDGKPQMRVFSGGAWSTFDASGNNSVLSAPFTSGGPFGTTCPPPGDAAYGSLTEGHQCLQVTIEDNGPNDKDGAVGTITDPSGLGIPTVAPVVDNRTSGTSGCTVAPTPASPLSGGAWWLLTSLVAWMGWNRRKSKQH